MAQIVRRFIAVSRGPDSPQALLGSVGLADDSGDAAALIAADVYYDLLERCFGDGDWALPFRYGAATHPEDFGAFGLAIKTAQSIGEALERFVRYILVVSDTLQYELIDEEGGRALVLQGRPYEQRFGVRLANEGALAAIKSILDQVAVAPVKPACVSFRHPSPTDVTEHDRFFGCPVHFGARMDALHFGEHTLATRLRLGDDGLSAFLLSQLDELHSVQVELLEQSLVQRVRSAVTDMLCDGVPRKGDVARQLGMSDRTLQRHLAEHGQSFQSLVNDVRRDVAQSLLSATKSSLSEVAFLTGFADQSAFQRAFKTWTGQTPRGYRQSVV